MINAFITNWIPVAEAKMIVLQHLAKGTYQKGQIKLSSYRWADLNDHSKGYLARVHVEGGIHPELELGSTGRKGSVAKSHEFKTEFNPVSSTGSCNIESFTMTYGYENETISGNIA